nr:hypothetical protein Q903MT_gene1596 [Picea sitchensis]
MNLITPSTGWEMKEPLTSRIMVASAITSAPDTALHGSTCVGRRKGFDTLNLRLECGGENQHWWRINFILRDNLALFQSQLSFTLSWTLKVIQDLALCFRTFLSYS